MKTTQTFSGLVVVLLTSSVVLAQRVQFATPLESQSPGPAITSPPPTTYAQPATPSPYLSPSPPALLSPPGSTYSPPPGATFSSPNAPYFSPTYTPSPALGSPPPAALGGTIQPPPATWDPYATPGGTPGGLLPQDPYCQSTGTGMSSVQKFIQHVNFDYAWFAGHGNNELGINDVNLSVTLAFPLLYNTQTPLLVTPGFAVHYWEGPVSVPAAPSPADMPPRTYDAYLDFAWNPWVTEYFGGELNFRTGIFSDFYSVTSESLRFMGKGVAVVRLSPNLTLKAGLWYLDRVRVKLLPAGGLVWTPNSDVYFDILFPNPKMGKRLTTWGNTEWWLYARGEYGGGVWTVRRNPDYYAMSHDLVDYDDIRIAAGLDFKTPRQFNGYFEVGLACSRELNYKSGLPEAYYPRNTVFLAAGVAY